jgi:hypothetical protein
MTDKEYRKKMRIVLELLLIFLFKAISFWYYYISVES